jgi:penicillin-binding protein 1C
MVALAGAPGGGGAFRLVQRDNAAPHLATRLLKTPGTRVATTLDADLQRRAVRVLREHLAELADRAVGDGALVVIDNASGDVLAWVGSSGDLSAAAQVDGVIAQRQAGRRSAVPPRAGDRGVLTAVALVAIATERGACVPQNYDAAFAAR